MEERIENDDFRSSHEIRDASKDSQILYLKSEIAKLECKQLSESVVSISGSAETEYELKFDPVLNVPPMHLDLEGVKLMSRYQQGVFNTSPYDAAIASAMKVSYMDAKKKGRKFQREAEVPPIKQIRNLFDQEVMGREIDFSLYGFCHHCKEIKPKIGLVKCKRNADSLPVHFTENAELQNFKRKKGNKRTLVSGHHKKMPVAHETAAHQQCDRMYCFACINFCYDQAPIAVQSDPSWICPYCQVMTCCGFYRKDRTNVIAHDAFDTN